MNWFETAAKKTRCVSLDAGFSMLKCASIPEHIADNVLFIVNSIEKKYHEGYEITSAVY